MSKSKWESSSLLVLCFLLLSSLSNTHTHAYSQVEPNSSQVCWRAALLCSALARLQFWFSVWNLFWASTKHCDGSKTLRSVAQTTLKQTANGYSKINTDKNIKCRESEEGAKEVEAEEEERQSVCLVSCVLRFVFLLCFVRCLERELYAPWNSARVCVCVRVRFNSLFVVVFDIGVAWVLLALLSLLPFAAICLECR